MNAEAGPARVGQWYSRSDKGEIFQVTGLDEKANTIEVQTFDGDVDEIDQETWDLLPLSLAEQPEDWTGPVDDVEVDDLGYSDTQMSVEDWQAPLQSLRVEAEVWEDTSDAAERDLETEGAPEELLIPDEPAASQRI